MTIAADNVTIKNTRITPSATGSGSRAVQLNDNADNFTIQDSTVKGLGTGQQTIESAVWNHHNNPGALSRRNHFYNCADCWEGAGTFRDDYMVVTSIYSGAHAENIYVCSGLVDVNHSTLINHQPQTATVFGDTICGGGNDFRVTNSLLAGGGYLLYPQSNTSNSNGTSVITGNRFARCITSHVYNPASGGHTCSGGQDANGFYFYGGYFGVAAYTSGTMTWSNNVWDDNGALVGL